MAEHGQIEPQVLKSARAMSLLPFALSAPTLAQAPATVSSRSEMSKGTGAVARRPDAGTIIEWVLMVTSYVVLVFRSHWIGAPDENMRFDALTQLLDRGEVPDVKFSLIGPLFSAPFWYAGKKWLGDPRMGCVYYNWVLFGVFLVVVARLLKGLLAPSTVRRFVLLLEAGSMFPHHIQGYYTETFTAAFVGAGLLAVCTKRSPWLGWIAFVLGSANTPAAGVAAGAVCLYFVLESRRLRFFIPVLAVGAIGIADAFWRRGGKTGYEGVHQNPTLMPYSGLPGFSYPILLGLMGLVLSFGKGIAFYAPGVFARAKSLLENKPDLLRAHRALLVFLLGLLVVYAKFCGWYGGEFWGPRYVLFASVPASFALAINLEAQQSVARTLLTLVMLTLSIWIGADGMVFGQAEMGQCWANGYALEHLCWYVPEFSAWIRPFIVSRAMETKEWCFLGVYAAVYVYLATPILVRLVRAVLPRGVPHFRRAMDWRAWGF